MMKPMNEDMPDPKLQALSNIVNELCQLFDTNLEALRPAKVEIEIEKEPKEEMPMEKPESADSMFDDLIKRKKFEE